MAPPRPACSGQIEPEDEHVPFKEWSRKARRAARKWRASSTMITTKEQAELLAQLERERVAAWMKADEKARKFISNKSRLESLAPTKKPKRTGSPQVAGLSGEGQPQPAPGGGKRKKPKAGTAEAFQAAAAAQSAAAAAASAAAEAEAARAAAMKQLADPNEAWEVGGAEALAAAGWERAESRSRPGRFYFLLYSIQ